MRKYCCDICGKDIGELCKYKILINLWDSDNNNYFENIQQNIEYKDVCVNCIDKIKDYILRLIKE